MGGTGEDRRGERRKQGEWRKMRSLIKAIKKEKSTKKKKEGRGKTIGSAMDKCIILRGIQRQHPNGRQCLNSAEYTCINGVAGPMIE